MLGGALRMDNRFSGAAYVVYGQSGGRPAVQIASLASSGLGFALSGPIYSWFGFSVCGAGDLRMSSSF